jgi:uncharacterized RDD family membrane protein YckC
MWYYASRGEKIGPVDNATLDELVRTGVVSGDTLLWQQGMETWQPLANLRRGAVHYGGFWIRFVARLIDGILVGVVSAIVRIPLMMMIPSTLAGLGGREPGPEAVLAVLPAILGLAGLSFLIQTALGLAYEVYFLSTRSATLGKMAVGLKVITSEGGPISAGLAAGRYFASWLSGIIFFIGYIMAAFDDQKRSLHDRICNTRVIYAK